MTSTLKTGVTILVVLFLGFYLINDPTGLAEAAKAVWAMLTQLFGAVMDFFAAVTG